MVVAAKFTNVTVLTMVILPNVGGVYFIEDEDNSGGLDFNDSTNRQLDRGEEVRALERKNISGTKLKSKKRKLAVGFHHGSFSGGTSL